MFLERGIYRRRRAMDAMKLIAIIGGGLWMIPVLWPDSTDGKNDPVAMSDALFYIFGVWILLIVLSAFLIARLRRDPREQSADGPDE